MIMSDYARGVLFVLAAGVCWSVGGIMLRSMESAGGWQVLFYRAIGMIAALLVVLAVRHRRRIGAVFRAPGWSGVFGGVCLATAFTTGIFSMLNTTVANTMFMQSTQVFFAAVLGWVFLRERVRLAAWVATGVALAGVAIMVADGLGRGTVAGNLLGLTTGLVFAAYTVILRAGRVADMLPAALFGGIFSAVASFLIVPDMTVPMHDMLLGLAMGVVQFGFGFTLFTLGSRHVPAAELLLLALMEVLLAPVWVWIGVGERVPPLTLAGGGLLLAAIAGLVLSGMRRRARRAVAAAESGVCA